MSMALVSSPCIRRFCCPVRLASNVVTHCHSAIVRTSAISSLHAVFSASANAHWRVQVRPRRSVYNFVEQKRATSREKKPSTQRASPHSELLVVSTHHPKPSLNKKGQLRECLSVSVSFSQPHFCVSPFLCRSLFALIFLVFLVLLCFKTSLSSCVHVFLSAKVENARSTNTFSCWPPANYKVLN